MWQHRYFNVFYCGTDKQKWSSLSASEITFFFSWLSWLTTHITSHTWNDSGIHTLQRSWHGILDICSHARTQAHARTHTSTHALSSDLLIHHHVALCYVFCHANLWMFPTHTFIKSYWPRIWAARFMGSMITHQQVVTRVAHPDLH